MLEIYKTRDQIEKRIGRTREIAPIEKGFSSEKKFKVTTEAAIYLLRLSPIESYAKKKKEFSLMRELHENGVRCNKPIDIFKYEEQEMIYGLYSFLPGLDAEDSIATFPAFIQYQIGIEAGKDLKRINRLSSETRDWKHRKSKKHEQYVSRYFDQDYRFKNDSNVLRFVETNYDSSEADADYLQHDDFHLGNIIIDDGQYVGILDFNRYDWGDPLHEFVKLEWFTLPVSEAFARGQVEGYFGNKHLDESMCVQICVYIAMSIVSTIVWTLKYHPHTWTKTERRICGILDYYDGFECVRSKWAI